MERHAFSSALAVVLISILVPLAIYAAAYLSCPIEQRALGYDRVVHSQQWATFYSPAVWIESSMTEYPVNLRWD